MEGKIFQQKLRDLGITQAQVADVLGITQQSVSSMMKAMSVKTSTLEKIAKGLGKDICIFVIVALYSLRFQCLAEFSANLE